LRTGAEERIRLQVLDARQVPGAACDASEARAGTLVDATCPLALEARAVNIASERQTVVSNSATKRIRDGWAIGIGPLELFFGFG
jgi:hypothetical protein